MCLKQAHIYFRVLFFLCLECQKTHQMKGNLTLVFQTVGQIETRFPAGNRDVNRMWLWVLKCRGQNTSIRFSPRFITFIASLQPENPILTPAKYARVSAALGGTGIRGSGGAFPPPPLLVLGRSGRLLGCNPGEIQLQAAQGQAEK